MPYDSSGERPGRSDESSSAGMILRSRRRHLGLTQRELAGLAGVGLGTVRDLEQGRTHWLAGPSARKLAAALGLDPADPGGAAGLAGPGACVTKGAALRLRVLGPVEADREGAVINLGTRAQRAVLGLLALTEQPVHRDSLIDALWPDGPPPSAVTMVQAYVSRLRKALDPAHGPRDRDGLLVSDGTHYRLRVSGDQLDLAEFRRLNAYARAARKSGDLPSACAAYDMALALWRGQPLDDLEQLRDHPAVVEMCQVRIQAVLDQAEVACVGGQPQRVLPRLRELAAREPLNEEVHAALITTLAAAGQQAAGLAVYDDLRRRLDEQLGVLPGPPLSQAYRRLLSQEPSATAFPAAPHQLPPAIQFFSGRRTELAALNRLTGETEKASAAVTITAVGGTAGVGKTALALHWAHQAAGRFIDGQLYLDLRGFDPRGEAMTPATALRRLLDGLGVPPPQIPSDVDSQAALYRSTLNGRQMLILLDNARSSAQVRPLLPGTPGTVVVITSRNKLTGLIAADCAQPITLDPLTHADARGLLSRRLGAERVAAEPDAVTDIIELCAGLPLALAVIAAHAAVRPRAPLRSLAEQLRTAPSRLGALSSDDPAIDVRSIFSWSYRGLTRGAARLFRLLSLHPGDGIGEYAAASLAGLAADRAGPLLQELVEAGLLMEDVGGRYRFHDLLRAYAHELALDHDSATQRQAAGHRLVDHYLRTAHGAGWFLNPARDQIALPPRPPGVSVVDLADRRSATDWFAGSESALLAIIRSPGADFDTYRWRLVWSLQTYLNRRGHWHEWRQASEVAVAAAARSADPLAAAYAHHTLAQALVRLRRFDDAHRHLQHALDQYVRAGDQISQAQVHKSLSHLGEERGTLEFALTHAQHSLSLFRAAGHRAGQARAFNAVGWYQTLLGHHEEALTACRQALPLLQELDDQSGEADTLDSIGHACLQLGDHDRAIDHLERACRLYRAIGDRYQESAALDHLGGAYAAHGDLEAAHATWRRSLTLLDDLKHPRADSVRDRLAGLGPRVPGAGTGGTAESRTRTGPASSR